MYKCINVIIVSNKLASWYLKKNKKKQVPKYFCIITVRLHLDQHLPKNISEATGFQKPFLACVRYSVYVLWNPKRLSPSLHTCRRLPLVSSFSTTSDISKSFRGRGIFLLAAMVFSRPGNKVVRATW